MSCLLLCGAWGCGNLSHLTHNKHKTLFHLTIETGCAEMCVFMRMYFLHILT